MRLVSQDGKIDVSYEQVAIEIEGSDIYCGYSSIVTRHCTGRRFAEYSSIEKALKAMEMLREQYSKFEVSKVIACGSAECMSKQLTQPKVEEAISQFWDIKIFQFPKDEEIEV